MSSDNCEVLLKYNPKSPLVEHFRTISIEKGVAINCIARVNSSILAVGCEDSTLYLVDTQNHKHPISRKFKLMGPIRSILPLEGTGKKKLVICGLEKELVILDYTDG